MLLPPVLPCLPWFVGLFVAVIFIVFCRAVGQQYSLPSFGLRVGFVRLGNVYGCSMAFKFIVLILGYQSFFSWCQIVLGKTIRLLRTV
ncbi:MAG TPA: hypothetical protein PKI08_08555, partial [Aquaticitalea sp.]|nr:hypothetical protein [Aquaticitalea sp.]